MVKGNISSREIKGLNDVLSIQFIPKNKTRRYDAVVRKQRIRKLVIAHEECQMHMDEDGSEPSFEPAKTEVDMIARDTESKILVEEKESSDIIANSSSTTSIPEEEEKHSSTFDVPFIRVGSGHCSLELYNPYDHTDDDNDMRSFDLIPSELDLIKSGLESRIIGLVEAIY